ncbi:MAG: Uma2 family endonuclease [Leptolyngbya sp. SIOISBB]|nr:Uma2 family endonuclease [Leptolyngbya sp. SIOISBB]
MSILYLVSSGLANRDSPKATLSERDYHYKYVEYAVRDIAAYWIVEHSELRQVTFCQWGNGLYEDPVYPATERLKSSLVPDLSFAIADLFISIL